MEWMLPVNEMLKDDITKVNYTLLPPGFLGDVRTARLMQESLSKVIDQLGEQSTRAQGLGKVITTADKLRNSPSHFIYLLKDHAGNGGAGEVIGLLKVGMKHLFLFDERGEVNEVEPVCVLDFYVVAGRRRHGYGRRLFDHMLRDQGLAVQQLAIDGPSPNMEDFLRKSYGVERLLRQSNNFAVPPEFFPAYKRCTRRATTSPAATPLGRFAAAKPPSAIATLLQWQ